jgi:hypothetical protein
MKKYFKELDAPGWEEIAQKTLGYVKSHTDVFERRAGLSFIFLSKDFLETIKPIINNVFSSFGIECVNAAVYVMNSSEDGSLHCDNSATSDYRINLPILNTKNSYLQFYQVSDPVYHKNAKYTVKLPGDNSINTLVARVEITQPTLISVNDFHEIVMDEAHAPRITMTLFFNKDLKFLLD